MKHFFTLVEFEYRKIWKRKSAILAMSVGLLVSILSVWGPLLGSTYINGKVSARLNINFQRLEANLMAQILIVEDDSVINSLIYEFLTDNGHLCRQAFSGTEGKLLADMETFDLILLDLMIPGMKGEDLLTYIRLHTQTPVIVLSARSALEDKVGCVRRIGSPHPGTAAPPQSISCCPGNAPLSGLDIKSQRTHLYRKRYPRRIYRT